MALSAARIMVSNVAVPLNIASTEGTNLQVNNISAAAVDLGAINVAAGTGYFLSATDNIRFDLKPGDVLYAIRNSAIDSTVTVLRS